MSRQRQVLVLGATGKVGREVVRQLAPTGAAVRVVARHPESANLPSGVEVFRGDLTDPESLDAALDGVDAVFLLWPFMTVDGAAAVVDAIDRAAERCVYLSAMTADEGFWGEIEQLIERSGLEWTFLQAGGFMSNTLMWVDQIRGGVVRWPYGDLARSLVDEADIAAVAVRALTEVGHVGQRYVLTGPETITQAEQVNVIGEEVGHPVRWQEISRADARTQLLSAWGDPTFVDAALDAWAAAEPEPVTTTVEQLTGAVARPFRDWARKHADAFR